MKALATDLNVGRASDSYRVLVWPAVGAIAGGSGAAAGGSGGSGAIAGDSIQLQVVQAQLQVVIAGGTCAVMAYAW